MSQADRQAMLDRSHPELLIIEVESRYGVSFSTTEIFAMTSFQGFQDALARKGVDLGRDDDGTGDAEAQPSG